MRFIKKHTVTEKELVEAIKTITKKKGIWL
jgi:hypothetical protein